MTDTPDPQGFGERLIESLKNGLGTIQSVTSEYISNSKLGTYVGESSRQLNSNSDAAATALSFSLASRGLLEITRISTSYIENSGQTAIYGTLSAGKTILEGISKAQSASGAAAGITRTGRAAVALAAEGTTGTLATEGAAATIVSGETAASGAVLAAGGPATVVAAGGTAVLGEAILGFVLPAVATLLGGVGEGATRKIGANLVDSYQARIAAAQQSERDSSVIASTLSTRPEEVINQSTYNTNNSAAHSIMEYINSNSTSWLDKNEQLNIANMVASNSKGHTQKEIIADVIAGLDLSEAASRSNVDKSQIPALINKLMNSTHLDKDESNYVQNSLNLSQEQVKNFIDLKNYGGIAPATRGTVDWLYKLKQFENPDYRSPLEYAEMHAPGKPSYFDPSFKTPASLTQRAPTNIYQAGPNTPTAPVAPRTGFGPAPSLSFSNTITLSGVIDKDKLIGEVTKKLNSYVDKQISTLKQAITNGSVHGPVLPKTGTGN